MKIVTKLQWIRFDCGGRKFPTPVVGLRPAIRWQKYFYEFIHFVNSVEITQLEMVDESGIWIAELDFAQRTSYFSSERYAVGELIELLDGPRVIAVGIIIERQLNEK